MSKAILIFLSIAVYQTVALASQDAHARKCLVPKQFQGEFFSIEEGMEVSTSISTAKIKNFEFSRYRPDFDATCVERWDDNSSYDSDGNHNSKILFYSSSSHCYECFHFIFRTTLVVQYKKSLCVKSDTVPTLEEVCAEITESSTLFTFFRTSDYNHENLIINCKTMLHGIFPFSYEWNKNESSCNNSENQIIAYQEPGSPYVYNQVFMMKFRECPGVDLPVKWTRYQCYGSWTDEQNNTWSAIRNLGEEMLRFSFRCMLTVDDEQDPNIYRTYIMSLWADCNVLNYSGHYKKFSLERVPIQFEYEPIQYLYHHISDTITCRVTGAPMPEVSWSFGGTDIVNREYGKGRYWISDDGLHILYLRDPEDSGEYICRAKDLITGVVEEKKITVIISIPAYFLKQLSLNYTVNDNRISAQITCFAEGSPPLKYTFYKAKGYQEDATEVLPSSQIKVDELAGTLQFDHFTTADNGYYNCMAKNGRGKAFSGAMYIYTPLD